MSSTPKDAPEVGAHKVIAAFFAEFLPGAKNEYGLLQESTSEPLRISLVDFQVEVLLLGLHCLDRDVMAEFGADYRNAFMDSAVTLAADALASVIPEDARDAFLERFEILYNARQREYGAMRLPVGDNSPKGTLFWEFAKRICLDAGAYSPVALAVMIEEAVSIFGMMVEVTETL
jgi:hypothetical protein